jgi:hypothetical protein
VFSGCQIIQSWNSQSIWLFKINYKRIGFLFVPVYWADIVQAATGDVIPRWSIGACHHPTGTKRYGVHFVCRVWIPYN